MATWTLSLRTASLFDRLRQRCGAPSTRMRSGRRSDRAAAADTDPARAVSRRRAEAMRRFFPKLSSWMAHHSHLSELAEVDRYLSQSTDIFDLERRIRDVERRGGATGWFQ